MLCEEFIDGDEVTCPVLGDGDGASALPVVRIVAPEGDYDYQNKYFTDVVRYECPSGLPAEEEARDPAHRPRRLPHARLPRLGPRRPDAARAATASPSCSR